MQMHHIRTGAGIRCSSPPPLTSHARIGLAAPASPIGREEYFACKRRLEELGFSVLTAEGLKRGEQQYGYLAGSSAQRAADLNRLFADPQVEAIFCVRGGYGSVQLLPKLDYEMIRRNPKIFVGYSDITSLHAALCRYCGLVTFHGPMVKTDLLPEPNGALDTTEGQLCGAKDAAEGGARDAQERRTKGGEHSEDRVDVEGRSKETAAAGMDYTLRQLLCACKERAFSFENPAGCPLETIRRGSAVGRLAGGNLSVLAKLFGTPYAPELEGTILFLEDVDESIPRVHMYLTQLEHAGVFRKACGVLLGDFTNCTNERYDPSLDCKTFLQDYFGRMEIPVLGNLYSDHRSPMGTLPLGAVCRMDAAAGRVEFFYE